MSQPAGAARKGSIAGNIFKGSVGNLIEWYDWYVYAAFSVYFSSQFFPKGDPTSQLLNTAAIFAVGFLMRPIGSLLLGRYADRHGRRAALTLSISVMAAGSLIIACTPSYSSIGIMAPIILVLARLLQGLSLGGEYGTSATYLSEMASRGRRGFYSSFQYVTLIGASWWRWASKSSSSNYSTKPKCMPGAGVFLSSLERWERWLSCGCAVRWTNQSSFPKWVPKAKQKPGLYEP